MTNSINQETATSLARQASSVAVEKKLYSSPKLEQLGDIRGMTMGGSPGVSESAGSEPPKDPKF